MPFVDFVKEPVKDDLPRRIKELKFGIAASQEIVKQGVLEVCHKNLYDVGRNRTPTQHGALDHRLGLSEKVGHCGTCGEPLQTCMGHFGYVKLTLPVLHIGYFKFIIHILQVICKDCSGILLADGLKRLFLQDLRRPNLDNLRRTQICKRISKEAKKVHQCPRCETINGRVKKNGASPLRITHERFSHYESSKSLSKESPRARDDFLRSFETVKRTSGDIEKYLKKAFDDLNPLRVLNLFQKISNPDCELLGMNPSEGRPEMFILRYLPVSPVCIRPSVPQDGSTTEDDITSKIGDICETNNRLKTSLKEGEKMAAVMGKWDDLQIHIAMLINSEGPGVVPKGQYATLRGFCQRLKGKQGRFRGNLSGKRVDFSGRTVISPDPNIGVDEVGIPEHVAKSMTFPERVTRYNIEEMRAHVINGPRKWPGANQIIKSSGIIQSTKFANRRQAEALKHGDVVDRHLINGDIVLFNRQPSLHRLSIMAHRVRVRPSRTFRLNECVCTPYNADFDGDEMNLHVPQTQEARIEAIELMGVKHNLVTPRNGEPIIAAIQDFITGAYLLSNKDNFFDRKTFTQLCLSMMEEHEHVDIPPPAILKPVRLWTGKQIFNVLLRPNKISKVRLSLDSPCREFRPRDGISRHQDEKDSWLCVRDSEIMCGVLDKATIGAGKKDSVFFAILRDFGEDAALDAMNRLARLIPRYLTKQGFSIGVDDVHPGESLSNKKEVIIGKAYAECDNLIARFKNGTLKASGAFNEAQTLEKNISDNLTRVRKEAGEHCSSELSMHNAAMLMAKCGSKGTTINVSQMVAVVGQQIINQERVQEGFQDRTLPHFPRSSRQPPTKGFVCNSFYSGLRPSELFFHAMSGREGLVDTAVKTAETGYMSRRLMKSLEDLTVRYDDTVRNSSGATVQFRYGDDNLDPSNMEGEATPLNFEHALTHAQTLTSDAPVTSVLPSELMEICRQKLNDYSSGVNGDSVAESIVKHRHRQYLSVEGNASLQYFFESLLQFVAERLGQVRGSHIENGQHSTARELTQSSLLKFVDICLEKYGRSIVQPGTAVGAIGAQSIGEPGTQMTLKTFHFAGIANLQITQGVPRMKEIINASKEISTPIITCQLNTTKSKKAAHIVQGRIEQTFLRDILVWLDDVWSDSSTYLEMKLDWDTLARHDLEITPIDVAASIVKAKKLHLSVSEVRVFGRYIRVDVWSSSKTGRVAKSKLKDQRDILGRTLLLKRLLPKVPVCGHANASRVVIKSVRDSNSLLVEGYGLQNCMLTPGVDALTTRTNSIIETRDVLGIEAARKIIIEEISTVMGDMNIDPRHMQLLGDIMTYRGEVLGITRFGLSKMRDSVLQLASFEKTADHLFEAAWHAKRDKIEGVSECIIMGKNMSQGTGAFDVVKPLALKNGYLGKKSTIFEDAWARLDLE